MTTVSILGLGPMGRALAAAFASSGHPTAAWNRTPMKAHGLAATIKDSAIAAIEASPLIVACLRDTRVATSLLDAEALRGRTLVNFSSGTPGEARAMAAWAEEHHVGCLDGVIVSTPDAIGTDGAALFFSGSEAVYEAHRHTLSALGANATYLGDDPGRASALDVSLQDLLWTSMTGAVHMFALAKAEGIIPAQVVDHAKELLAFFPEMIDALAHQISADEYSGEAGSVDAAALAMDHVLSVSRLHGIDSGVVAAARAHVQRTVESGYGSEGFARLATIV